MKKGLIAAGVVALTTVTTIGYAASAFGSGNQQADAMATPPSGAIDYVKEQPTPVATALVEEQMAVGKPLSSHVVLMTIPGYPAFGYATVNNKRVIVDEKSRRVMQIIQ